MEDTNCDNKPNSQFTWQQVAEHNRTDSAWVIHNRKVYDVTSKWISAMYSKTPVEMTPAYFSTNRMDW